MNTTSSLFSGRGAHQYLPISCGSKILWEGSWDVSRQPESIGMHCKSSTGGSATFYYQIIPLLLNDKCWSLEIGDKKEWRGNGLSLPPFCGIFILLLSLLFLNNNPNLYHAGSFMAEAYFFSDNFFKSNARHREMVIAFGKLVGMLFLFPFPLAFILGNSLLCILKNNKNC